MIDCLINNLALVLIWSLGARTEREFSSSPESNIDASAMPGLTCPVSSERSVFSARPRAFAGGRPSLVEAVGDRVEIGVEEVGVDVERHGRAGMSDMRVIQSLDGLDVRAGTERSSTGGRSRLACAAGSDTGECVQLLWPVR
jgi:hypothetical protein